MLWKDKGGTVRLADTGVRTRASLFRTPYAPTRGIGTEGPDGTWRSPGIWRRLGGVGGTGLFARVERIRGVKADTIGKVGGGVRVGDP